jgi:predicted Fe-Mo cluster-binding NifX family protein
MKMKKLFAIPTENGKLCEHFGHCEKFAVIETEDNEITAETFINPPAHQPGVYPQFLAGQGVSVIIAGGMGQRAQQLFYQNNIEVYMGVNTDVPSKLVEQYLNDQLKSGENPCDH